MLNAYGVDTLNKHLAGNDRCVLRPHSGAPAVEGRHVKPHTYRTHAFIFLWSSTSAAYGLQARAYKRRSRQKMAAYGGHLAPSLLPPSTIIIG